MFLSDEPTVFHQFRQSAVFGLLNYVHLNLHRRSSTFRMPTRVTLNDSKRQSWLADLANPDVPLYKLGKSVPHGAKGHDLLDLLHSNRVAIPRAVWFLRVLGANETVRSPRPFVHVILQQMYRPAYATNPLITRRSTALTGQTWSLVT